MVRAADSVGANLAEAMGRHHTSDKRRLLHIARGSLYETEHWASPAYERGLLDDDFGNLIERVAKTLNGLIRRTNPE